MIFQLYNAELKPGQVIHINRVTFCLGQLGQTCLAYKISRSEQILISLIILSGQDQSDELCVLDGYDGSAYPDSPQAF